VPEHASSRLWDPRPDLIGEEGVHLSLLVSSKLESKRRRGQKGKFQRENRKANLKGGAPHWKPQAVGGARQRAELEARVKGLQLEVSGDDTTSGKFTSLTGLKRDECKL
jgi:hypothetical protein